MRRKTRRGLSPRMLLDALEPRQLLATFTVDSLSDAVGDDGVMTLREAITAANDAAGADEVVFADSLGAGTLTLTGGQMDVTEELTIRGPGREVLTIDADNASRVFGFSAEVTLLDMTLINGLGEGAGGGAIVATAPVTLERVAIRDSHMPATGSPTSEGGAIVTSQDATLRDVVLENNSSEKAGGAIAAFGDGTNALVLERVEVIGNDAMQTGGGVLAVGLSSVTITDSSFLRNTAGWRGGGVRIQADTVTITGTTFDENTSSTAHGGHLALDSGAVSIESSTFTEGRAHTDDGRGGAIYALEAVTDLDIAASTFTSNSADFGGAIYAFGFAGDLRITNTTISDNNATDTGGGLYLEDGAGRAVLDGVLVSGNTARRGGGVYADGAIELVNSTISGNEARRSGGGLFLNHADSRVLHSTIALNRADTSNSTSGSGGGISASEPIHLFNSIVGSNYKGRTGETIDNLDATLDGASDFNLTSDDDPGLAPLADNGGPTLTHAVMASSAAVSAGPTSSGLVDQRGEARPDSSPVDIGAFQHFAPSLDTLEGDPDAPREGFFSATATGSDPDGDGIASVEFYVDANDSGMIDDGELVATVDGGDSFVGQLPTAGFGLGETLRYFAIAYDAHGFASGEMSATVTIVNNRPVIGSIVASSMVLVGGGTVTLTAGEVDDADGSVASVAFYLDEDGDGEADASELFATDDDGSDGFAAELGADGVALGVFTVLAVATDNDGESGDAASVELVRGELPVIASAEVRTERPMQGRRLTVRANDVSGSDATTITVRVYVDRNVDGEIDATELIGTREIAPGEDAVIVLSVDAVDSLPLGASTLLLVATNDLGVDSEIVSLDLELGFDTRAGVGSSVAGVADGAGVHRSLLVNGYGQLVMYEQTESGWQVLRLDEAAGLVGFFADPIEFTGGVQMWTDPKDGLTYAAATTADGLYLFTLDAEGAWTAQDLATVDGASAIGGTLTRFTATGGLVSLAGFTSDGRLVVYTQTGASGDDGYEWGFTDISAQTGSGLTSLGSLTSYVTAWNQWSIVGLDANGDIQNFWFIPGQFTEWRVNNLSEITGAPALASGLSPILTSWQGINLTALDADGNLRVTWWVPSFGGEWQSNDLTEIAGGTPFVGGGMTSYYTSWDGMNYAGLDADSNLSVYWWVPGTNEWRVSALAELNTNAPSRDDRAGDVRMLGNAADDGTLSVFAVNGLSELSRVWWEPGQGGDWMVDDLSGAGYA